MVLICLIGIWYNKPATYRLPTTIAHPVSPLSREASPQTATGFCSELLCQSKWYGESHNPPLYWDHMYSSPSLHPLTRDHWSPVVVWAMDLVQVCFFTSSHSDNISLPQLLRFARKLLSETVYNRVTFVFNGRNKNFST